MERSADSDDLQTREGHRIIARWLYHFITSGTEELIELDRASREDPAGHEGDYQYMDFDSESQPPKGSEEEEDLPQGIHQG